MNADQYDVDSLLDVGRRLVQHVDRSVAQYRVLSEHWNPRAAMRARDELCSIFGLVADDEAFWESLRGAALAEEPAHVVGSLAQLPLDAFEEFERELLEWAEVEPSLAAEWAASTSTLLRVIRDAAQADVAVARWIDADQQRAFVRLAQKEICSLEPPSASKVAAQPNHSRRFRKRLWGGIKVGGGLGQLALNGAVLLGGAPIPLVNVPTTVFGGGSILGGVWTTVSGAETLDKSRTDDG